MLQMFFCILSFAQSRVITDRIFISIAYRLFFFFLISFSCFELSNTADVFSLQVVFVSMLLLLWRIFDSLTSFGPGGVLVNH